MQQSTRLTPNTQTQRCTSPNNSHLTMPESRIWSPLQTAKLKSPADVNGSSPLIPTGCRAGRERALGGLPLDREVKGDFQVRLSSHFSHQLSKMISRFRLLGTHVYAASSGIWSKYPPELHCEESGRKVSETSHFHNSEEVRHRCEELPQPGLWRVEEK